MGRGGAKQDSESMEAQIHDTVKYIQRIMSIFIKEKILNELLFEGGYNPILNEEDIVCMSGEYLPFSGCGSNHEGMDKERGQRKRVLDRFGRTL